MADIFTAVSRRWALRCFNFYASQKIKKQEKWESTIMIFIPFEVNFRQDKIISWNE